MYLVTDGEGDDNILHSTTEVMSATGSSWSYVGSLPRATRYLKGITLNNQMFITGGKRDYKTRTDEIMKFNPTTSQWEKTGELIIARSSHAMSVLPLKEIQPYCLN